MHLIKSINRIVILVTLGSCLLPESYSQTSPSIAIAPASSSSISNTTSYSYLELYNRELGFLAIPTSHLGRNLYLYTSFVNNVSTVISRESDLRANTYLASHLARGVDSTFEKITTKFSGVEHHLHVYESKDNSSVNKICLGIDIDRPKEIDNFINIIIYEQYISSILRNYLTNRVIFDLKEYIEVLDSGNLNVLIDITIMDTENLYETELIEKIRNINSGIINENENRNVLISALGKYEAIFDDPLSLETFCNVSGYTKNQINETLVLLREHYSTNPQELLGHLKLNLLSLDSILTGKSYLIIPKGSRIENTDEEVITR